MRLRQHHASFRLIRAVAATTAVLAAVGTAGALSAGATPGVGPVRPSALVSAGTAVPGAPNCPMFAADNICNTDISRLPVDSRSAAWLRSMNSSATFLHPDSARTRAVTRTGRPIMHAIRVTAQVTAGAYIWPARHEAGAGSSRTRPPMGARFRLRAGFNVAGFCRGSDPYCADARAILVEMQHYGLILADNGSNWYFGGSAFPQWPGDLVSLLKGIPARDFVAVSTSCLMVSRDSGQARARPGCPVG